MARVIDIRAFSRWILHENCDRRMCAAIVRMSTTHSTMADNKRTVQVPVFESTVIDGDREDGYWVETFHFNADDKIPGVITSGLGSGIVELLDNPIAEALDAGITAPDEPLRCE